MSGLTLEQALDALGYEADDVADYKVFPDHVIVELTNGQVLAWPSGFAPPRAELPEPESSDEQGAAGADPESLSGKPGDSAPVVSAQPASRRRRAGLPGSRQAGGRQ